MDERIDLLDRLDELEAPDLWAEIEGLADDTRATDQRRGPMRVLALVAATLVGTVGLFAALTIAFAPSGEQGPSPNASPAAVADVHLGQRLRLQVAPHGQLYSMVEAAGSLWVLGAFDPSSGETSLRRLDPSEGSIQARFDLPLAAAAEWGGDGLIVGGGFVWGTSVEDATVYRVDPADDSVTTFELEGRVVSNLAYDEAGDRLWAMLAGRADESAALVEIDPDSGAELSSETFQLEWSSSLLPAGDAVWTLAREVRQGTVQGGYLHQLTPGNVPDIATGGSFALPVTDGEWIWSTASGDEVAMNLGSGIARVDPADGSVDGAWETGVVGYDIAIGPDRGVWFLGRRGLERLNPSSGIVQTWRSGDEDDSPTFIVPVRDGVWLGTFGGALEFRPFESDRSTAAAETLTVPDVVGQNFLSALGWVDPPFSLLESEYRDAAGYENGTILEQDPAPGTQVDASETEIVIRVVVSVAPWERLRGTAWRLRVMDGRTWPIGGAPDVTIEFKAHRVHGFSGCNGYSAPYRMEGRRLILGRITGTLIGCSGERDWVEERLLRILEADPIATAREDELRLVATPEGVADFGRP